MKLSVVLIIACTIELHATVLTYAQTTRLTMKMENATIKEVFDEIEKSSQFIFVYYDDIINLNKKVSISVKGRTIEKVLEELFKSTDNTYEIIDRQVVIKKKTDAFLPGLMVNSISTSFQQITITGKVTETNGTPLPGVSIVVEGTTTGTATDADGNYSIKVAGVNTVLVFSYIGYLTEKVTVAGQTLINVVLAPDITKLEDVVVVGFGRQKKISTIGSQSSITAVELKTQPVANITNAISGHIAGIIGVQRSGQPGYDGSEIYIRGISTFTNSSPLILVDGIERSFNNIDPEDIASFTILKDASATAVYGVRGANGVIIIETKKGKTGKPVINVEFNQGITQFTKVPEFADGVTYLRMANEAYKNSNPNATMPLYSEERIQKTADGSDPDLYPNIRWFDEMFSDFGQNRRANLNVNGGSEKATYYLSVGYYNETGLFKTDEMAQYNSSIKFTRYNFTSNLTLQLLKNTKVDFGASGWISDGNYPGTSTSDIWNAAYSLPPVVVPVRYSNGYIAKPRAADVNNPYDLLTQTGYVSELRSQLWSNIRVTQDLSPLLKGLSVYALYSFDNYNSHNIERKKTVDAYLATGKDASDQLIYEQTRVGSNYLGYNRLNGGNRQFYTEAAINYTNTFGKHEVGAMVLYNQSDKSDAFAGDFINSIPTRFQGIASRATYSFDNKYLAEVNLGYNGSETFESGKRFGLFPSYGVGWVASNEKFFEPISNIIQFLKLRGSYGVVGNSAIGGRRFAYIATVGSTTGYSFGSTTDNSFGGLDIGEYAVDVTWEKAKKSNIGIELHTWSDALTLTVDLFKENRTGIFLKRDDLPDYVGVRSAPWGNLGEIHNKGVDATVTLRKKLGNDLSMEFRGNFTWNRAIIVENASAPWLYPWQQRIGRKLGQRFGKIALGLFESQDEIANSPLQAGDIKPGDIKYKDLNADGKIDSYDEAPIGSGSMPELVYGFGPSISYKGFAVGAWFKGISNVDISLNGEGLQPFRQEGTRGNLFSNITDRWTPDNTNGDPMYPRLTYPSTSTSNYDNSSWWVKNGAFLRLQNIEISYTLPNKGWFSKLGFTNFRVYAIGYNVATFSGFDMWDVELGDGKGAQYPLTKSYNFGFECQF